MKSCKKITSVPEEKWIEIEKIRDRWANEEQTAQYSDSVIRKTVVDVFYNMKKRCPLVFVVDHPVHAMILSAVMKGLFSQLFAQLFAQLRAQLDAQLDAQLFAQLDAQLFAQLRDQLGDQLDDKLGDQLRDQLFAQLDDKLGDQLRDQLFAQLDDQLRAQLGDQLRDQLGDQLDDKLGDQLRDQLFAQLDDQLRAQLGDQLFAQLDDQLRAQLGDQLRDQLRDQLLAQLRAQLGAQLGAQLSAQLRAQLRDQLLAQLRDQLRAQLRAQLIAQLRAQFGVQLDAQLRAQLDAQLRAQLRDQLLAQLDDQLRDQLGNVELKYYCGLFWNIWAGWFEGAELLGVKFDADAYDLFDRWNRHCPVWMWCDHAVYVLRRPGRVCWNADNLLHNDKGPSVEYSDGTPCLWNINGVSVDEQIVMSPESQTLDQIIKERNNDVKMVRIERFGWGRFLSESKADLCDERFNRIEGTREALYKTQDYGMRFVATCPTGRLVCLGVPSGIGNCQSAQEWLAGNNPFRVLGRT